MELLERPRYLGFFALAGGAMGLLLAPFMVTIKYMTGWAVIPQPGWVGAARRLLGGLLPSFTPAELWTLFGSLYTLALLLLLAGLFGLTPVMRDERGRAHSIGWWILLLGLLLVIPGDAVHTWTWHQHGLTVPTPGTNPVANTAYAVHMMGMNLIMVGSLTIGVSALRRKYLAPWLAWSFLLIFPSAVLASTTFLPTTPSGALWLLSGTVGLCGYWLATGQSGRLGRRRDGVPGVSLLI
jgi:hypothetical protein